MNEYCCDKWEEFDRMFGNMQVLIHISDQSSPDKYGLAKDVWNFKYCPFCGEKL